MRFLRRRKMTKMEKFDYEKVTVKEYRKAVCEMCNEIENCEDCILHRRSCANVMDETATKNIMEKNERGRAYDRITNEIESACDGICNEKCPLMVCGNCMKIMMKKILRKVKEWENEQSIQQ